MFMDIVEKYFTGLSERQLEQFQQLEGLYREWNEKINVISRKDIDALNVHHVLHSLAIAKVISFKAGTKVLDVGTGGGFPGICRGAYYIRRRETPCTVRQPRPSWPT